MLPRKEILNQVEHKDEIIRIIDQAEKALKTWELVVTDFLSPPVLEEVKETFNKFTELQYLTWGGYPQAERNRVGIAREDMPMEESQIPLVALDISGNFLFDSATHPDFLGAILGTGIVREKIGDIIVLGERGAQVIVMPEIADFLETSLIQVRSVPVKTKSIDWSELKVRPPNKKELTTVEASLRLDAIASFGFKMSRGKMADAIKNGSVRVNWKEVSQVSYNLKTGDIVSFRGKGRLEIGEINVTKKERFRINVTRFV